MKTVVRESLAMIVIVIAILLIIVIFFFDYIKDEAEQPTAATYTATIEEQNILQTKEEYESDKDTIVYSSSYSVNATDLTESKSSGDFKQGQSSPFDEVPITDVLYDSSGNIYYQVQNSINTTSTKANTTVSNETENATNTTSTTNTTNSTNTASTTTDSTSSDITTASSTSGSMAVTGNTTSTK